MTVLKKILLHSQIWLLLFILNYILIKNDRFQHDISFQLLIWGVYLLLFYINYLVVFRFLFSRKNIAIYIITSILLLALSIFTIREIRRISFKEDIAFDLPDKPFTHSDFERKPPEIDRPPPEKDAPPKPPFRIDFNALTSVLLVFSASISLRFYEKWQENEQRKSEIEKEKISTELSYLKQQINPHFLFNSLNSIYSLSMSQSVKTTESILKLSSILRYMLYKSDDETIFLSDEIKIITDYIDLQRLRLTNKVKVNYTVDGDPSAYKIAPFILIPIIENAFKHGVDNINQSFIEININIKGETLYLKTANTRINIKNKKDFSSEGIGMKNIKRRLELLYPNEHLLDIEEREELYILNLEMKLKK